MIRIKSISEIKQLEIGGKILAEILRIVKKQIRPGVTTVELNQLAEEEILSRGGEPSFLGYGERANPFPAALCTSVNEQLVHGVPGDYILENGDILSLDLGMKYPKTNGLYTDMAVTAPVGKISKTAKNLLKVTKRSLDIWIKNIKPGADMFQIANKVQKYVEMSGYSVIRDLVGHGVGNAVHEEPQIPNYFIAGARLELKQGMVLALEPMVSAGDYRIKTLKDGWTIVTRDKSLCAHFEHTVAVTASGCSVLTKI